MAVNCPYLLEWPDVDDQPPYWRLLQVQSQRRRGEDVAAREAVPDHRLGADRGGRDRRCDLGRGRRGQVRQLGQRVRERQPGRQHRRRAGPQVRRRREGILQGRLDHQRPHRPAGPPAMPSRRPDPRQPRHPRLTSPRTTLGHRYSSTMIVTGPSLTRATFMSAPKRPLPPCAPRARASATTASTSGSATGPGAALLQVGRLPLLVSAYRVNWLIASNGASTSEHDFSPSRMRSPHSLAASLAALAGVSSWVMPTSTARPGSPMAPATCPSTVTL